MLTKMMHSFLHFLDEQSKHLGRPATPFRVVVAISVLRIAASIPFNTGELLRGQAKGFGESSDLAGDPVWIMQVERQLDAHYNQNGPRDIPSSDAMEFPSTSGTGGMKSEKNAKTLDDGITARHEMIHSATSPTDQARNLLEDFHGLKEDLKASQGDLNAMKVFNHPQSAYMILESIVGEMDDLIKSKIGGGPSNLLARIRNRFSMTPEADPIVNLYQRVLSELEYLLSNHEAPTSIYAKEHCHSLEVQVFKILNFSLKHEFLKKEFAEEWINSRSVLNCLAKHICNLYNPHPCWDFGLQEGLSKSKASEHLLFFLAFLHEESWNLIELELLKLYLLNYSIRRFGEKNFVEITERFQKAGLENVDSSVETHKKENIMKEVLQYFQSIESYQRQIWNPFVENGLLYKMLYLLARYHTKIFLSAFDSIIQAKEVLQKLKILHYTIFLVKKSDEIEFMTRLGLWISQGSTLKSNNFISLEDSQVLTWIPRELDQPFQREFEIHLPKDKKIWMDKFKKESSQLKDDHWTSSENIFDVLKLGRGSTWFRKNFLLSTKRISDGDETRTIQTMKISYIFLHEVYTWIERLRILFNKFNHREELYVGKIKEILESNGGEHSDQLKNWLMGSSILQNLYSKIGSNFSSSLLHWNLLEEKVNLLNKDLPSSSQNPTHAITNPREGYNLANQFLVYSSAERGTGGFKLPEIEFFKKTTYSPWNEN